MLHRSTMMSHTTQDAMRERRSRLHQQLAEAYATPQDNWRGGRIYRLADEIADVERALAEIVLHDAREKASQVSP